MTQSPNSLDKFIAEGHVSTNSASPRHHSRRQRSTPGSLPPLVPKPLHPSSSSILFDNYWRNATVALCFSLAQRDRELADTNAALRVLQRQQEGERKQWEQTVCTNIRASVSPLIERLKSSPPGDQILHLANLLEECLEAITDPFIRDISSMQQGMTPREIQIAALIRQGKNSKDISVLLGVSLGTVNTHRNNVRKKLRLKNKDISLQAYLLSLA